MERGAGGRGGAFFFIASAAVSVRRSSRVSKKDRFSPPEQLSLSLSASLMRLSNTSSL